MQKVNQDFEPLLVTAKDSEDAVVVMSKRDYDSMQETMYLLSNPDLMARIRRGDKQIQSCKVTMHDLLEEGGGD